ncbi:MAG: DUF3450 domain-containing protein [Colwellia sp.]|nr:DUF3450 domain-containing protein [Colwellia sp.]
MKSSTLARVIQVSLIISASTCSYMSFAQDNQLKEVVSAGKKINQSASISQQKVNQLTEQTQTKLQAFKTVNKELDGLQVYNQQMQIQLQHQLAQIDELSVSMQQVSIIERQISPLMASMISTLEIFVELDVPFLEQEREKRINDLKSMITRADIPVSEKFRRVLEAYQVEVDYGRTIEAYTGLLAVNGSERDVDFLRIGRVSLVYKTRDGNTLGVWQQSTKNWQALDGDYRLAINKGLRIARKQLAPDLMIVPINAE